MIIVTRDHFGGALLLQNITCDLISMACNTSVISILVGLIQTLNRTEQEGRGLFRRYQSHFGQDAITAETQHLSLIVVCSDTQLDTQPHGYLRYLVECPICDKQGQVSIVDSFSTLVTWIAESIGERKHLGGSLGAFITKEK